MRKHHTPNAYQAIVRTDLHVVTGGVRVGADLMRRIDELLSIFTTDARQVDVQIGGNSEAAR